MTKFVGIHQCEDILGPAVVIDVLRAFTVAPLALSRGASEVVLVNTLEEALLLKSRTAGALAFKDGPPAEGFDLLNSPGHLLNLDVRGRTIYQKTTAGTRAAIAAKHCQPLICSSFVCASATADFLRDRDEEVTYVISGDEGRAAEDLAAARLINALVLDPSADAAPFVEAAARSDAARDLRRGLELGYAGVSDRDLEICFDVDRLDFCLTAVVGAGGVVLRSTR